MYVSASHPRTRFLDVTAARETSFPPPMSNIKRLTTASAANEFLTIRKNGKRNTFDFLTKSPAICSAMSFFKQKDNSRNNLSEHEHVIIIT